MRRSPDLKQHIMRLLYREDILRKAHDELKTSLVGSLYREYTGDILSPTPRGMEIKNPFFRAVVDMLIAQMMHHFAETIIERIVDIIIRHEEEIR